MKNVRQEQLGQTRKLDEQLETLTKLKVSSCLLVDWLKSISLKLDHPGAKFEYLLGDKVDEHQRVVDETYKDLASRLRIDTNTSPEIELQIRALAISVAANELSLRTIKNEVIPSLFESTKKTTERIVTVDAKLDHLALKYRADYQSLCSRMAKLEREMAKLKDQGQDRPPNWEQPVLLPRNLPLPIKSVPSNQKWQPDAYVTSSVLCTRAVLKESNYTYYARVHTDNGIVVEVKAGDIYIDCGGKVVMVLR
jgi:hypothetical protein